MKTRFLSKEEVIGTTALVRVDYNVPVTDGEVTDTTRIQASVPTILFLLKKGYKIVLMSHCGKPKGERKEALSMKNIIATAERCIGESIVLLDEDITQNTQNTQKTIAESEEKLFLLENLRFHAEEENNDTMFAEKLALLGDIYVNDSFSVCHRAHASISAITKFLPSYAGLGLEKEITALEKMLHPPKPFILIVGGAKINDKISLVKHLLPYADKVLLGSAMLPLFLDNEKKELAEIKQSDKTVLPIDYLIKENSEAVVKTTFTKGAIPLDIGPATIKKFLDEIDKAEAILWNGPLGFFEDALFAQGTKKIARAIAKQDGMTMAGGGSTVYIINQLSLRNAFTHVSTGGGALLQFLAGNKLPGIDAVTR